MGKGKDMAKTVEDIKQYISELSNKYKKGITTEHSFRGALETLLKNMTDCEVINEARHIDCGAPDLTLLRKNIPIGYVEAKDVGKNLNSKEYKNQFDRYKKALDNIIFTDYLDFWFYKNGEFVENIRIAELKGDGIIPVKESFTKFENLIKHFGNAQPQKIVSSAKLAELMAGKARLMAEVIENVLSKGNDDGKLAGQMAAFKEVLIHNITPKDFADVYAQTIAYGMFAARLHGNNSNMFSREEAAKLIPKTNPFLRQLFQNIAGYDLDERISWIVDDLAETFRVADMDSVMKGFGKRTQQTDPMIHFYENFLSVYDPALRKSRGVWYTPQAVVNFIVRAVDEILQDDFKLQMGLADTSKIKINVPVQATTASTKGKLNHPLPPPKEGNCEIEMHKVQILDPATGTGTFLAETVSRIHDKFDGQGGLWQGYVEQHLIPRLNGFELLMASYTMAHIKLDYLLAETGYQPTGDKRLNIYLTNSLEEYHSGKSTLFAQFLAREANEANRIKRDTPVMVVLGNPPYSGESKNKSEWITGLMEDYKKEPDTNSALQERNPKWINDDYCKFIRLGQFFVDKNNEGILAYINNHSFIDNPTFRGMRWNLMKSFDKIYIIDLHGNSKKKEVCLDGSKDENVFDIQQGVSINIFVKKTTPAPPKEGNNKKLAEVYHFDLFGKREEKYKYLLTNNFSKIPFTKLQPSAPEYFFVPKNYEIKEKYDSGFSVQELFPVNSVGIVTARDNFTIHDTAEAVKNTINDFIKLDVETARKKFDLGKDVRDWSVAGAKKDLTPNPDFSKIVKISYRPFDTKFTYYTGNSKGFHCMPRGNVMQHFLKGENIGLVTCRQVATNSWELVNITKNIVDDSFVSNRTKERGYVFPLYLYHEPDKLFANETRKPNLNKTIINEISKRIGLQFVETPLAPNDGDHPVLPSNDSNHPLAPPKEGNDGSDQNSISEKFPTIGEKNSPPLEGQGWLLRTGCGSSEDNHTENTRNTKNYMDLPFNPKLKERARELRKAGNLSEVLFWNKVKNKQFKNFDFDRQKIIGNYIVDFYCTNCNVVIEIDGSSHDDKQEYDAVRDDYLKSLGLEVIHITDIDIKKNITAVMAMLYDHPALTPRNHPLGSNHPLPPPKEGNEEGNEDSQNSFPENSPPLEGQGWFAPIDVLDYIYAVLHSPAYRERYKEFLKIDFPRVPYPENAEQFWKLVELGGKLRRLHLLEGVEAQQGMADFPVKGTSEVEKPEYKDGKVWINDKQYFDNVPSEAWSFYIGGYQPAQKWLKDRKGRKLGYDDIRHYQRIVKVLKETGEVMRRVDEVGE